MKKSKIALIICLLLMFHTTQVKARSLWEDEELPHLFGTGVILFPYDKKLVPSLGVKVDFPIIPPIGKTYLHLDLGWYIGKNLGSTEDGTFNYGIFSDKKDGYWSIYDDGIRIKNRDCEFLSVSLNWDMFFRFADDKVFFHFGPSIGTTMLFIEDKYEYRVNGTDYKPSNIFGVEPFESNQKYKAVFNYGANIGLKYLGNDDTMGFGLEYQFMYNHKTSFEKTTFKDGMHRISFVFVFLIERGWKKH